MGNINSVNDKYIINFEKMLNYINNSNIIINTLKENEQNCLIENTVKSDNEVELLNKYLKNDKNINIIIYGKNSSDISIFKKYEQLNKLGFKNVSIYVGGIFEWLLLQEVYGNEKFKTTTTELDILKYK